MQKSASKAEMSTKATGGRVLYTVCVTDRFSPSNWQF